MPAHLVDVPMVPRGHPLDGTAIAAAVTAQVRRSGTHALPGDLLVRLSELRRRHGGRDRFLDAFLMCVLARHDGRFYNRTYLALPLLEQVLAATGVDPGRLAALLIADVVRFELRPASGDLPDATTRSRRIRHALRFVAASAGGGSDRDGEALDTVVLPELPATAAASWFAMSVQPVSARHDEYFFIRALQAHEMVFTVLADCVVAATAALRAGRVGDATRHVEHADAVFTRAAMLFRIVATLRTESFHDFREHTDGASAIQSEQYKRFEAACGTPTRDRLDSAAFTNVPDVRDAVESGQDTLTAARLGAAVGGAERAALDRAMASLEDSHQRWKSAHRGLAVRMLGDAMGSGHTAGVPYLQRCLANRLFSRPEAS